MRTIFQKPEDSTKDVAVINAGFDYFLAQLADPKSLLRQNHGGNSILIKLKCQAEIINYIEQERKRFLDQFEVYHMGSNEAGRDRTYAQLQYQYACIDVDENQVTDFWYSVKKFITLKKQEEINQIFYRLNQDSQQLALVIDEELFQKFKTSLTKPETVKGMKHAYDTAVAFDAAMRNNSQQNVEAFLKLISETPVDGDPTCVGVFVAISLALLIGNALLIAYFGPIMIPLLFVSVGVALITAPAVVHIVDDVFISSAKKQEPKLRGFFASAQEGSTGNAAVPQSDPDSSAVIASA